MTTSASVKDVARRAGVSLGTVSNVLNHPDRVRDETRERVQQAIADLGFVRNESARQLRAGQSRVLSYLVPSTDNPFFTDVARGAREAARPHSRPWCCAAVTAAPSSRWTTCACSASCGSKGCC